MAPLTRINQADRAMQRIDARISSLLEEDLRRDFQFACWLVAEVRQYAQAVGEDALHMPKDFRRDDFIAEARERLLKAVTPSTEV